MDSTILLPASRNELKVLLKEVLQEILTENRQSVDNNTTLMNIQEAAALLNLAVATLYEKTSERSIPHYKHGKKIMFKKSELLAWVESRKVKTIQEIRREAKNFSESK